MNLKEAKSIIESERLRIIEELKQLDVSLFRSPMHLLVTVIDIVNNNKP